MLKILIILVKKKKENSKMSKVISDVETYITEKTGVQRGGKVGQSS